MYAIRRILHPTDFSTAAPAALRVACSLAEDYGAELALLHVWDPHLETRDEQHPHVPANSLEEALAWLDAIELPAPSVRTFRHLVVGDPVNEIVLEAKEGAADLIVMGTHSRTGLNRLLTGSVAEGVLRQASCPVMTVRETPHAGEIGRVAPKANMVCA
jgi:nucleotide-binding universal stress UspA family protein